MNLIDHYNTTASKFQASSTQSSEFLGFLAMRVRKGEEELPQYLVFMRCKLEKEFPRARLAAFVEGEELAVSLVHAGVGGGHDCSSQVLINEQCQSITVRGSLLANHLLVRMESQAQLMMALRRANALNPLISPLRLAVDPLTGSLSLLNCSYVDSHFTVLNNSEKNIEYFTQRVIYLLRMILQQIDLLFYLMEDDTLAMPCQTRFPAPDRLTTLENSLYRTSLPPLGPKSKRSVLNQHHLTLSEEISDLLKVYDQDTEKTEYCKPVQLETLASENYEHPSPIADCATDFQELIKFSIYTVIRFAGEVRWEPLAEGGFGKVERGTAHFALLGDGGEPIKRQKNGDTEEEKVTGNGKKITRQSLIQARITRKTEKKERSVTQRMEREKGTLRRLKKRSHPNVMTYFQSEAAEDRGSLFSLYEENQSLELFLQRNEHLSFFQKVFMLEQAAKGVLLLHKTGIVHLDLKPANLIVGKKFLVKVCDFGESFLLGQPTKTHKFGLSFPFAAPEAYAHPKVITEKYDVYSLGVTIFRCLFSQHVWGELGSKEQFLQRLKGGGSILPVLLPERFRSLACSRVARLLVHLCLRCVSVKAEERSSLQWAATVLEQCRKSLEEAHYK